MCGSLEIDSAIDVVKGLSRDLAEVQKEAKDGKLLPLPGESVSQLCSLVTMVTLCILSRRVVPLSSVLPVKLLDHQWLSCSQLLIRGMNHILV